MRTRLALVAMLVTAACGGAPASIDGAPTEDAGGDAGAPADAAAGDGFVFVRAEAGVCPNGPADCAANWPTLGTVTHWVLNETFGDRTFERTAWLYRPPGTDGQTLPLLVYLHGGNGNGADMFARKLDELARGDTLAWRRATATCIFDYSHATRTNPNAGYVDINTGAACVNTLPVQTFHATERFAVLFPDGVPSVSTGIPGARHWEDGRTPSPGQLMDAPSRDDVGFIATLIAEAGDRAGGIDPTRIYLAGVSNGGMMTHRIMCEQQTAGREPLRQIAAAAMVVSTMPANIYDGTAGRPMCPRTTTALPALYLQVGRNIDTPTAAVSGDGIMPFGVAGMQYTVASPDGGLVQSFPDTRRLWVDAMASAYGQDGPPAQSTIGQYSNLLVWTFGANSVELRVTQTDGAAHEYAGARFEFASDARQWDFLASFARVGGAVTRRAGASIAGAF